jgi:hypothetical protein
MSWNVSLAGNRGAWFFSCWMLDWISFRSKAARGRSEELFLETCIGIFSWQQVVEHEPSATERLVEHHSGQKLLWVTGEW